jgi:hypothetical protein
MLTAVLVTAEEFSCRPSELLAIEDPVLALAVDLAARQRAVELRSGKEPAGPVERMCL